jgi:hypothetical protein
MTDRKHPLPAPEELPALYVNLLATVERLEGMVQQLLAEGNHSRLTMPTWRDFQELKADVDRLRTTVHKKTT